MALLTDPIDIELDDDGDMVLANGDFVLISGLPAKVQQIRIALQMFKGEWFLDLDEGVPYFANDSVERSEAIFGQPYDEQKTRDAMRTAILGVDGVVELVALEVSFDGASREVTVRFKARTVFGDTPVVEVIV